MKSDIQGGVFLNGKAQIIEMLKIMPEKEKQVLIKNLKIRNPQLAGELISKSFSFKDIFQLGDAQLKLTFSRINPKIIGMAIKDLPMNYQRKALTLLSRESAEVAYDTLTTNIPNEAAIVEKSQKKVLSYLTIE